MKRWKLFYLFNLLFYLALLIVYYVMGLFEKDIAGIIGLVLFKVLAFIPMVVLSAIVLVVLIYSFAKKKYINKPISLIIFLLITTTADAVFFAVLGAPMLKFLYIALALSVLLIAYQAVMLALKQKNKTEDN